MWVNKLEFDQGQINNINRIFRSQRDGYNSITPKILNNIKSLLPNWTDDHIMSYWSTFILRTAYYNNKNIENIPAEELAVLSDENLIEITKKYDVSPLQLCTHVLKIRGCKEKFIEDIITYPANIPNKQLQKLITLAIENDHNNATTWKWSGDQAKKFEYQVIELFTRLGCSFKPESQIITEQIRDYGRAISSPDILFNKPITIKIAAVASASGGIDTAPKIYTIYWMDAKSYMFVGTKFITEQLHEQAKSYVA